MEAGKGDMNKQKVWISIRSYLALGDVDEQLDRGQVVWKWVSILHKFQERNPGRPNISTNAVLFATDSLGLCGR